MQRIVIVGAGFSGVTFAIQLIRQAPNQKLQILLIGNEDRMGRGMAYRTQKDEHFLNVPVGNMSALDHDPNNFLDYCRQFYPHIEPSSFVPRSLYGDYLEWLLRQAECSLPIHISLSRIVGYVNRVELNDANSKAKVSLADGRQFDADKLILATGNHSPQDPQIFNPKFYSSRLYIKSPWNSEIMESLDRSMPILLIGTGLTALDVCTSLAGRPGSAPIYAISRHGLLPNPHRIQRPAHIPDYFAEMPTIKFGSLREKMRAIRRQISLITREGGDWREIIGALRPNTQQLWKTLSTKDRSRFMRHARAYWEIHRHRVAPEPYKQFEHAVQMGTIKIIAGRLIDLKEMSEKVHVSLRPRYSKTHIEMEVGRVINCTGPGTDLYRVDDELTASLLRAGLIQSDHLGLGLDIDENCAVRNQEGVSSQIIFYVGPSLRSRYWEATAIPELRVFASNLAATVLNN